MLKVGITGGIGSGKSTISAVFVFLGVPFYNADERAKWISNNHPEVIAEIKKEFGVNSFDSSGLNKKYISKIVFSDISKLNILNSIIHPRVGEDYDSFCNEYKHAPYTLKEAAIMYESGTYKNLDKTILVIADKDIRIKRVIERDGISRDEVLERMDKQMSDSEKQKLSDFVIYNNSQSLIIPQVLDIHQQILSLI